MRWLLAHPGPGFSVHDVFVGWQEALDELGEQTFEFNLDDRLAFYDSAFLLYNEEQHIFRKACTPEQAIQLSMNGLASAMWKIQPHVLLVVSGFFLDLDLLDHARRLGTKVVLLCTESPYEDDRQLVLAPHCDLVLLNDPTNIDQFREVGPVEYVPHAYRPSLHHPGPPDPALACDLAFVGTGYPSRVRFFEAMNLDGLTVKLGGNWMGQGCDVGGVLDEGSPLRDFVVHDLNECMHNWEAVPLYRSARMGINLYRREAAQPELEQGWSVGPREIEMAAIGLPFLRDPRPEGDALFPMLPTFSGPEEAGELLRWWLDRPGDRMAAINRARAAVADRTFTNNAKTLLRLLDRQPVKVK